MKPSKVVVVLASVLLLGSALACQKSMPRGPAVELGPGATVAKYIAAFNARDEGALRAAVKEGAPYIGTANGDARPLIEQNLASWSNPSTADARLAPGKLNGADVIVIWWKPHLPDGTISPWTPGAYLSVDVASDRIVAARGTLILGDPSVQAKLGGEPPK
jgi:hypothetical protein